MNGQSLRALFESLNDPLGEKGRKQPLGQTLTMVFLAMVSGMARRAALAIEKNI